MQKISKKLNICRLRFTEEIGPLQLVNKQTSCRIGSGIKLGSWTVNDRQRERSGSVVECLTRDIGVSGSSLMGVSVLARLPRHGDKCLNSPEN